MEPLLVLFDALDTSSVAFDTSQRNQTSLATGFGLALLRIID